MKTIVVIQTIKNKAIEFRTCENHGCAKKDVKSQIVISYKLVV